MKLNYYQILGVNRYASLDEIKKSYRYLVFHFHPDRNLHSEGELIRINEAYRVLSNSRLRSIYDESLPLEESTSESTPKMKWIRESINTVNEGVEGLSIIKAKSIRKDIETLINYLNIAPLNDYTYYGETTSAISPTYTRSMYKRNYY